MAKERLLEQTKIFLYQTLDQYRIAELSERGKVKKLLSNTKQTLASAKNFKKQVSNVQLHDMYHLK